MFVLEHGVIRADQTISTLLILHYNINAYRFAYILINEKV